MFCDSLLHPRRMNSIHLTSDQLNEISLVAFVHKEELFEIVPMADSLQFVMGPLSVKAFKNGTIELTARETIAEP